MRKLNNRGFTITELVVASGIGVVLAGIATFTFIEAMTMFNRTVKQYQAETDMLGAMISIKSTFSRSIYVKYRGASLDNPPVRARTSPNVAYGGLMRYTTKAAGSGVSLVAFVNREMGDSDLNSNSKFNVTGVYYQTYSTSPHKSGALYVDIEKPTDVPLGWAKTSPSNATLGFGRFTEFAVQNIRTLNKDGSITMDATDAQIGSTILSADFKMVMRYYTKVVGNDYRWCPSALISGTAACQSKSLFYDIEKRVKVVFANNAFEREDEGTVFSNFAPRVYGNIYFFRTITPTRR